VVHRSVLSTSLLNYLFCYSKGSLVVEKLPQQPSLLFKEQFGSREALSTTIFVILRAVWS